MKSHSLKLWCLISMLSSATCYAYEGVALSRDVTGLLNVANETILDSTYLSLKSEGIEYYAGFIIDSEGLNQPAVVRKSKGGHKQKVWKFNAIIADLFLFNSQISVALDSGEVYSLKNDQWRRSTLMLAGSPRIVFSDGKQHLIACSPSSLFKEGAREGGCESYNPNWKLSFSWHDVRPKVCGELLYAVTWEKKQNQRIAINLESGEVVKHELYANGDVCAPFSK